MNVKERPLTELKQCYFTFKFYRFRNIIQIFEVMLSCYTGLNLKVHFYTCV
jgi:hypothetical protein